MTVQVIKGGINTKRLKLFPLIYKDTMKSIFYGNISLIFGQGLLLFLYMTIFIPTINIGFKIALRFAGFSYITIHNLKTFLLNPISIVTIGLIIYLTSLFILFEIYFLIIYFSAKKTKKKLSLFRIIAISFCKVIKSVLSNQHKPVFVAWIMVLIFNIPTLLFGIRNSRFLQYLLGESSTFFFYSLFGIILSILVYLLFFRKSNLFNYYLINKISYKDAISYGKDNKKNKPYKALVCFAGYNVILGIFLIFLYFLFVGTAMMTVTATMEKGLAVVAFIVLNEKLKEYILIIFFIICTVSNSALYVNFFYNNNLSIEKPLDEDIVLVKRISYRKILIIIAALFFLINSYVLFDIIKNGSTLNAISIDKIEITAHRGFSKYIPENTLPSIERAIEERADYVEIDVRITKDGEFVLLHDANLRRTTGVNKNIWDVTYEEIKDLDAGSWKGQEFSDVRIPLLWEAFEVAKGKTKLNIDLKYAKGQEEVANRLVDIIHEYKMERQCIVTSTRLEYLEDIKEINEDIRTGYITYQIYPKIEKSEALDVFSMKSSLVSKNNVLKAHENGKKIYVWTVNERREVERLSRLGVDNIITDNPVYVREVLYQSNKDQYLIKMLKSILK